MASTATGSIPATQGEAYGFIFKEPLGVILGIAPWNAPIILGLRAVLAPITVGNVAILKVLSPWASSRSNASTTEISMGGG